MPLMKTYLLLVLVFCSVACYSQYVQLVTETDIPGVTITRSDTFSGQGLYGYIDGGADLFLEYGFREVFVNEYSFGRDKVTLEIFVMEDAPSAYGIYSLSVAQCRQWNKYGTFSCITPYQAAASSGPLFINATNRAGTQSSQALCEQLVSTVLQKNPQEIWRIPPLFQSPKLSPFINTLRSYDGILAVTNAIPAWNDLFENIGFTMLSISVMSPECTGTLARIVFPEESSMSTFLLRSGVDRLDYSTKAVMAGNGLYRSWFKINETKILFLECNNPNIRIKDMIPYISNTIPGEN
jgi:hypothetical protein